MSVHLSRPSSILIIYAFGGRKVNNFTLCLNCGSHTRVLWVLWINMFNTCRQIPVFRVAEANLAQLTWMKETRNQSQKHMCMSGFFPTEGAQNITHQHRFADYWNHHLLAGRLIDQLSWRTGTNADVAT